MRQDEICRQFVRHAELPWKANTGEVIEFSCAIVKKTASAIIAWGLLVLPATMIAKPPSEPLPKISAAIDLKTASFDLSDVRLLDGPFRRARDLNAKYLLSLDPDRLLSGVRTHAGLQPKAPTYGGWEAEGVAGQSLGHFITALAQQYRATGDNRYLERVNYIVDELATCQIRDHGGYVAAIPDGKAVFDGLKQRGGRMEGWVPWYTMHKLFAGMRDAYLLCGNNTAKELLLRLADWANAVTKELTPQEMEVMMGTEHGGMPEVLADVYAISGNPQHLALARRFCHRFVMDPLARGEDRLTGLHANTQIPKITGAARLYETTGEDYFKNVAENFWNNVVSNRSYVIGGNSDNEHFFPPEEFHRHLSSGTCETCNTYNMLKLTEHLAGWNPSTRWIDYYERALYNQILASQDPETGMFTYFVSLKPGHFKIYSSPTNAFWCCVGTGMENHTKYGKFIFTHSTDSLWVNLFIASEVDWVEKGVTLRQETDFPNTDSTRLVISTKEPRQFALKIRSPNWLTSPLRILVNGKEVQPVLDSGYATIARLWQNGDRVDAKLSMSLRTESPGHTSNLVAVLYGPIVLAAELGIEGMDKICLYQSNHNENVYRNLPVPTVPVFVAENSVIEHLQPVEGQPLTFQSRNLVHPSDVTFIPFYRMHHQRYSVYLQRFTPTQWSQHQSELRAAEERRKAFEIRTVDDVQPGEQQPEINHAFKGEKNASGEHLNVKWRDARDGGWLEYTMKVLPDAPMQLSCTYWGGDTGAREFDILVDGLKLATQKLNEDKPGEFFEILYPIPPALTKDKQQVTIRFQAHPGNFAGGLFGMRILKP